jgi:hypothetical protein
MRSGNLVGGAEFYNRSIELAIAMRNVALWCRAYAHFALECARYDKNALPQARAAIMKVYDGLNDQGKLMLSDVPAMLARAESLQPASDVLRSLEQFRKQLSSYPTNEEAG